MKTLLNRTLINSILFTSGLLTVFSGILLFNHLEPNFVKAVHELGGFLLLLSAVLHLMVNWKALRASLRGSLRICLALVALCSVLMLVSVRPWLEEVTQAQNLEALTRGD